MSACMPAEHFSFSLPITDLSGWHVLLLTKARAQETTKSNHYLDYIMGTTDPCMLHACPRYSDALSGGHYPPPPKKSAGVHAGIYGLCVSQQHLVARPLYWHWCLVERGVNVQRDVAPVYLQVFKHTSCCSHRSGRVSPVVNANSPRMQVSSRASRWAAFSASAVTIWSVN